MARLRVVDGRYGEQVTLPRTLVVEAAMEATALADDMTAALAAIEACIWGGNRAAAMHQVGRAGYRVEQMRMAFADLAGLADSAPTDPGQAAAAAA